MLWFKKNAEFVGYVVWDEAEQAEWRCPNKKCGLSVSEDFMRCPYCGQRLKFELPKSPLVKMIELFYE